MFNESSRKHLGIVTQIYADMRLGLVWQRYSDAVYLTLFTWINPGALAHSVTLWEVRSSCQGTPRGFPILLCEMDEMMALILKPDWWAVESTPCSWDWWHIRWTCPRTAHASCPQFGGKLSDHRWENCCVSYRLLNVSIREPLKVLKRHTDTSGGQIKPHNIIDITDNIILIPWSWYLIDTNKNRMELLKSLKILVFNFTFMGKKSLYWYQGHLSHLRTTIFFCSTLLMRWYSIWNQGKHFKLPVFCIC